MLGYEQLFKNFHGIKANAGITTKSTGDFGFEKQSWEKEYSQNWRVVELMKKNSFFKIIPEHGDGIIMEPRKRYVNCDGLIWRSNKNDADPILMCPTGDCPILTISSKDLSILAIVHSGRQGTALGIIPKTITAIRKQYFLNTEDLEVGFWPGICGNCYEIEKKMADFFPHKSIKHGDENKVHLSLKRVILTQLRTQGIPEKNISILDYCPAHSMENGDFLFYSLRRNGTGQRNLVYISK